MSLCIFCFSPLRYIKAWSEIQQRILHFFILSIDWKNNTEYTALLHDLAFSFFCRCPVYFSLLLHFSLSFSLSPSPPLFLPICSDTLFVTHSLFYVYLITESSVFPPLYSALSWYSQFAAAGWEMHMHEHTKPRRCFHCIHCSCTQQSLSCFLSQSQSQPQSHTQAHTCTHLHIHTHAVLALKFYAGSNYELLLKVSTASTQNCLVWTLLVLY